ncbi:MAG: HD domain-containing protein [Minisyncoccia bacterium]
MNEKLNHPLVRLADQIAEQAHRGQQRKWADDPYIVHPRRVAAMVAGLAGTDHIDVAAALLHDVVEDTEVNADKLADLLVAYVPDRGDFIGLTHSRPAEADEVQAVLALVLELTKDYPDDEEKTMSRAEKRERDWAQLRKVSDRAKRIKMCDRYDNITGSPMPSGMRKKYKPESLTLVEICGSVDPDLHRLLLGAIDKM